MAGLDGKITIERELRPCIVHIPCKVSQQIDVSNNSIRYGALERESEDKFIKGLFHMWSPATGKAIVEYEDGTVHEVEPQNIRFVDNAMCEYAFSERNKESEKCKGADWRCPVCAEGHMKLDEGIVLTSNPPMYRYVCDKCGHTELSRDLIGKWDNES